MLTDRCSAGQVGAGPDVEADHLAPGVHAGVGAPGAGQLDGVAQDALEGAAEGAGHRGQPGLEGETVERRTEIGDEQAQPARPAPGR